MFCITSDRDKAQFVHSKAIDKAIAKDKIASRNLVQLLFLGLPRSGKTTLVRQLRLISGERFTQEEIQDLKQALVEDLVRAMRLILTSRQELVLPWTSEELEDTALILCSHSVPDVLERQGWRWTLKALVQLWQDDGVRSAWNIASGCPTIPEILTKSLTLRLCRRQSRVSGDPVKVQCLQQFLEDPVRLFSQNFSPSVEDVIHIYKSTSGVSDCEVLLDTATFRLVEMGGRSLTSSKLLRYFDNANAVIFIASCADVEQRLVNGKLASGFHETLSVFSVVIKDPFLSKLPVIILFTKLDILLEKTKHIDFKTIFPEFSGDSSDVDDVKKHICDTFRNKSLGRHAYHHFVHGVDVISVQNALADIKRDLRDHFLRQMIPQ